MRDDKGPPLADPGRPELLPVSPLPDVLPSSFLADVLPLTNGLLDSEVSAAEVPLEDSFLSLSSSTGN